MLVGLTGTKTPSLVLLARRARHPRKTRKRRVEPLSRDNNTLDKFTIPLSYHTDSFMYAMKLSLVLHDAWGIGLHRLV
jgi:hypothetical protein